MCGAEPGWAASPGLFWGGSYGSVCPHQEEDPRNLLYRCLQAQIFWGDAPPSPSRPRPWGPGWTQSSQTTGTNHLLARRYSPLRGKGLVLESHRIPILLSSPAHATQRCSSPQTGDAFGVLRSHSPSPDAHHHPLPGPQHPACQPGAGRSVGWCCHGRRPRRQGQTGEAGTGTASPLVNSAGPCSLFKALNRGWYLSSPEFGARGLLPLV